MHATRPLPGPSLWEGLAKLVLGVILSKLLLNAVYGILPKLKATVDTGIVSMGGMQGIDSRQNYLVFGVSVLLVSLVVGGLVALKPLWPDPAPGAGAPRKPGLELTLRYWFGDAFLALSTLGQRLRGALVRPWVLGPLSVVLMGCWILNAEYVDLAGAIVHSFHEGEYLGFIATLQHSTHPFSDAFFIHGYGVNALPDVLAQSLGMHDNGIAAARLFRVLESSVAWLGVAWVVREIVRSSREKGPMALAVAFTLLAFLMLDGLYELTLRRSLSLIQLALVLRVFRSDRTPPRFVVAEGVLLGATLPLALLYDYSEAVWAMALYVAACPLVVLRDGRRSLFWLIASLGGLGAGAIALVVGLGGAELRAMLAQVAYWARHGREIWFIPITSHEFHSPGFALMVLAASLSTVYLLLHLRRHGLKETLRRQAPLLLVLFGTLLGDRVGLDRGIGEHFRWAAVNNCLLLATLVWSVLASMEREPRSGDGPSWPHALAGVGVIALVLGAPANLARFSPFDAISHVLAYSDGFWTADAEILPQKYRAAVQAMGPEISRSSSLYVLTSDALWYRAFWKPSASRFHHLTYARAPEAQAEVVRDLERRKPEFVLSSPTQAVDHVSPQRGNPQVYHYVLAHYQPYRDVADYTFWRRTD